MADSFLVLVPHKTLHGTISILIQRPKLATNVGKMGAVKNKCLSSPNDEECSDPIEDEHHAIFDCSASANAQEQYRDLFQIHITTVGDVLNQPQCNRLAKFLTLFRMLRMNRA